jgi:hypothetical protein
MRTGFSEPIGGHGAAPKHNHERLTSVAAARLAEADGRAERAEQALAGERSRSESRDPLEAAEELRQAEAARQARGLVVRLRAAWRGQ